MTTHTKHTHALVLGALLGLIGTTAQGAMNVVLPGSTEEAVWVDLNNINYAPGDGFNTFGTNTAGWPTPITADAGSATFDKLAGTGGYPASASIYTFTTPGTFFVSDSAPLAGLETIVFQMDVASTVEAGPVLSYNGGSQELVADFTATAVGDFVGMSDPTNIYAYQWDLSGLGAIAEYTIEWTTGEHGGIYRLQINSGDSFAQAIPEPSTYAAWAGIGVLAMVFQRRKRR